MNLYDWQLSHAEHLLDSLKKNRASLDLSDLGTGKTVIGSWVASQLGFTTIVVCPKAVVNSWEKTLAQFEIPDTLVVNYEKIKGGRLAILDRNGKKFQWNLPQDSLIIFDEVQACKSYQSLNGAMLVAAKKYHVLMLSATAVESPLDMQNIGLILDLYQSNFYSWALKNGCRIGYFGGLEFGGKPEQKLTQLQKIHETIKPKMSRISIKDLGDRFPTNVVYAESYDLTTGSEIRKIYKEIEAKYPVVFERMGECEDIPLVSIQKERQKIELLKLDYFEERTKELLESGKSIILFVNYRNSVAFLKEKLQAYDPSIIIGDQTETEREENIEKFQTNKTKVCLCTLQSGGVGLNLNDVSGGFPRVALISPSFDARQTSQALGRASRANSKSTTIQYVVFCADTIEEKICLTLKQKLKQIGAFNGQSENQITVQ